MNSRFNTIDTYALVTAKTIRRCVEHFTRSISITAVVIVSLLGVKTGFAEEAAKIPTICMIPTTNESVRSRVVIKNAKKSAESQGAKLVVHNQTDHRSMDDQFTTFKSARGDCDAILIEPLPPSGSQVEAEFASAINATIKKGTPVVAILGHIKDAKFTSHITFDGRAVGDHLARQACKRTKAGDTVFHVFPHYQHKVAEDTEKVALKEFSFQVKHLCPDVKFVRIESEHPRDVQPTVIQKFEEHGSPALILTDHPKATVHSLHAIEGHFKGKAHNIKLVGFGSSAALFNAIEQDKIHAAIIPDHTQFSEQAITAAVLAVKQQVNLGTIHVPLREMTKDNAHKHKDFHSANF